MLVLLLSLVVLSVHGESTGQEDDTLRQQVEILTETMEMLEAENAAMKSDILMMHHSKQIEPLICFSAVKNTTQSVLVGDNILFEEVLIDSDDSFYPVLGFYLIPEDGIYEVIVTMYKYTSSTYNNMFADLYLDDTFLTRVNNYFNSDTSAAAHSTSSIIREFQAGDRLHVEAGSNGSFYGSTSYKASQFSAKYVGAAPAA